MDHAVYILLIGGFVAWRVYRRMRRNIGRQPLRPRRIVFRLSILCLVCLVIFGVLIQLHLSRALASYGGGTLIGIVLGFVGLRLTRFETTDEGHFYIPDTRMGVGISLLLTGRLLYRFIVPSNFTLIPGHPPPPWSPLTLFFVGITFGYFVVYLTGLFVHTHDKNKQQNALSPENSP
jgi:hypothetical protein